MDAYYVNPDVDSMFTDYTATLVTVKVENIIWYAPRDAFLRHSRSQFIHDMFRRPELVLLDKEKNWIGNAALLLHRISRDDFRNLLIVLAHEQYFASPRLCELLRRKEWEGVRRAASVLTMPEVIDRASWYIDIIKAKQEERKFRRWQAEQHAHHEWLTEKERLREEWEAKQRRLQEEEKQRQEEQWLADFPPLSESREEGASA